MASEVITGIFALGGATLGFAGAITVEYLRGRATRERAAAERREHFQVDTLTRAQEVAREMMQAIQTAHWHLGRISEEGPTDYDLREKTEGQESVIRCSYDMMVLTSRMHDEAIASRCLALCELAADAANDDATQEERVVAKGKVREVYVGLQSLAGREILRILEGRRREPIKRASESSKMGGAPAQRDSGADGVEEDPVQE